MNRSSTRPDSSIFVASHRGTVGSAMACRLQALDYADIVTATRAELRVTNPAAVHGFSASRRIEQVILGAARAGDIHANDWYPGESIHENPLLEAKLAHARHRAGVQRPPLPGSSCVCPRDARCR